MNGENAVGDDGSDVVTSPIPVRPADPDDLVAVMNVLDGSLMDIAASTVRERIAVDAVLVAGREDRVRGALVLSGTDAENSEREIEAIAVRRRHRKQGIGSALVAAARAETDGCLIAEFDARVRPFYDSLGFRVRPVDDVEDGRFHGYDSMETPCRTAFERIDVTKDQ